MSTQKDAEISRREMRLFVDSHPACVCVCVYVSLRVSPTWLYVWTELTVGAATVHCDLGLVKGIIAQSQRMDFLPILKTLNTIERSGSDGLMDKDKI